MEKIKRWCRSNTPSAKCTRTIFQGILSAFAIYIPDIIMGCEVIPNEAKPFATALLMAVISPIQATIGGECDE